MHYVTAKSILSPQNGLNLYRGCQHGCIYCDARSSCYQMNHPFEDIAVKENGIALLAAALRGKRRPCMVGTGAMSDPYMPLERTLGLTRKLLEVIERQGCGVTVLTKSDLVLRDLELLRRIHSRTKAVVQLTLTTWNDNLCRIVEPGVCPTSRRVEVLKELQRAGIPTVVWLCPILPWLNDTPENIRAILEACGEARVVGVVQFGMGLTLREGNREYYYAALDRHFPGLKARYIRRYGNAYQLPSPREPELLKVFHSTCEQLGLLHDNNEIFRYLHTLEEKTEQLRLF